MTESEFKFALKIVAWLVGLYLAFSLIALIAGLIVIAVTL